MFARKDRSTHDEMYEIFLLLVESGVSLESSRYYGGFQLPYPDEILYCTVFQGNIKILKYLAEERKFDLNAKLSHGKTAIMVAVENNDKEMAEYLLSKNVDRNIVNDDGKSVRDIAEELGNEEMIQLLK